MKKSWTQTLQRPIVSESETRCAKLVRVLIAMAGFLLSPVKHRLYWRFCNLFGKLMRGKESDCVLSLDADSRMKIFLSDPYWSRLISSSYEYEPDLKNIFLKLKDMAFSVLDCGANFGYWSILLSSKAFGEHKTVAVEAAENTFRILDENCRLNHSRFQCLYYALSSESGKQVMIESPDGHAGAFIKDGDGTAGGHAVRTITLDDLAEQAFGPAMDKILVKLDVEGQEINSLKGASRLLKRDVLFYYEDHGHDPDSQVTDYVLNTVGLNVFYCDEHGALREVKSAAEASRIKTRKSVGYNFIACKQDSEFLKRLRTGVS